MGRFTSRTFRKHISKKSRKTRRFTRKRNAGSRHRGGGDTFSRRIPPQAVKANPLVWDDEPVA